MTKRLLSCRYSFAFSKGKETEKERAGRGKGDGTIIATFFFHSEENWKRRDEINACSRKWIITGDTISTPVEGLP